MSWTDLYQSHEALRTGHNRELTAEFRERLLRLADLGHCSDTIRGRVTERVMESRPHVREIYIRPENRNLYPEGTEPLSNLAHLDDACLTLLANIDDKLGLEMLTIMIEGTRIAVEEATESEEANGDRPDDQPSPDEGGAEQSSTDDGAVEPSTVDNETAVSVADRFVVAVHYTRNPEGAGACGHALLHCHVGTALGVEPSVRVPLPPLRAPEVLDWVLTVITALEPAPWTDVMAEIAAKSKAKATKT